MPIDSKYGRVQLERGTVGEDEPVFVFRAQDETLPELLAIYRKLCVDRGSPRRHLDSIDQGLHDIARWQQANHTQVPQSSGWLNPDQQQKST